DQILPAQLRQRVHGLESVTMAIGHPGEAVDPAVLTRVAAAVRNSERLRFEYGDREGTPSTRTTEPCGLACTGRRWYLMAWDVDRQDWRTFRLDRITQVLTTGPGFEPREPPEDVATFVRRSIAVHAYRYQARVTLHAPMETLAARIPHAAALLTPIDANRCLLETGTDSLMWLAIIIVELGVAFEVHDPPELITHMRELGARLIRAAGECN